MDVGKFALHLVQAEVEILCEMSYFAELFTVSLGSNYLHDGVESDAYCSREIDIVETKWKPFESQSFCSSGNNTDWTG